MSAPIWHDLDRQKPICLHFTPGSSGKQYKQMDSGLTSADVWRLSGDREGAGHEAGGPEQQEQGDQVSTHHGDLQ